MRQKPRRSNQSEESNGRQHEAEHERLRSVGGEIREILCRKPPAALVHEARPERNRQADYGREDLDQCREPADLRPPGPSPHRLEEPVAESAEDDQSEDQESKDELRCRSRIQRPVVTPRSSDLILTEQANCIRSHHS